jgi:polar amino acid transport system substrate-binding protein
MSQFTGLTMNASTQLKAWVFPFVFLTLSFFSQANPLDNLSYTTEEYPPFNFTNDSKALEGIGVDLLMAALKHQQSSVTVDKLKVLPWTRGYRQALKGPNTVLFSTTRTEQREPLFKWAGPIVASKNALIARADAGIKINDKQELANYSIGVVRDDIGEQLVRGLEVVSDDKIKPQAKAENIIQQLQSKRIDMLAYEVNSLRYQIKKLGLNNDDFVEVFVLNEGQLYYAFSPDVPDETVKALQTGIDAIKANGEYDKILKNYQ